MKIKEAAQATGLTEKTIRFYEEKGFIEPEKESINGREFRSYSEEDVNTLRLIADLRKLDFSLAEITGMRDNPQSISAVLKDYYKKASEDLSFKTRMISRLEKMDPDSITGIGDLADRFKEESGDRPLPLPDSEPEFFKLDGLTREALTGEVEKYHGRLSRRFKKRVGGVISLFVLSQLLFLMLIYVIMKLTYNLGYIPAWEDMLGWRIFILPCAFLCLVLAVWGFIKAVRPVQKEATEQEAQNRLKRAAAAVLSLIVLISAGLGLAFKTGQRLEDLRADTGRRLLNEWYALYRMTEFAEDYLETPQEMREGERYSLYINQSCYNFAFMGYGDTVRTRMHDFLVWAYDPLFKELVSLEGEEASIAAETLFAQMNGDLKELCGEFVTTEMTDAERAIWVRHDSERAESFRQRANALGEKYVKEAEAYFSSHK